MFTCLQVDFSETLKLEIQKKDLSPIFMLIIAIRIKVTATYEACNPQNHFFNPNSDLDCHFKMSFTLWNDQKDNIFPGYMLVDHHSL